MAAALAMAAMIKVEMSLVVETVLVAVKQLEVLQEVV
jgi:hypothetical protein